MFTCNICNYNFKKKQSLQIHLNEKRCKSYLLSDLYQLHQYIGKLKTTNESVYLKINKDLIKKDINNINISEIDHENIIKIQH